MLSTLAPHDDISTGISEVDGQGAKWRFTNFPIIMIGKSLCADREALELMGLNAGLSRL